MAAESIIRGLLNKGKAVRDIEEPWWSRRYGNIAEGIKEISGAYYEAKQKEADKEFLTLTRFQSRVDNQLNNALNSGEIYSDAKIGEIREVTNNLYHSESDRNPHLRVEFTEKMDATKAQLDKFQEYNKQYNSLLSKIPATKKFLDEMSNELSETTWDDMTPEKRMNIKNRLLEGTQDIATLKKILSNPYFQNKADYPAVSDDVEIGIMGGYNGLLRQVDTWDDLGTVLSETDKNAFSNALFKNRPEELIGINDENTALKIARVQNFQQIYTKGIKDWKNLHAIYNSPIFIEEDLKLTDEYTKFRDETNADATLSDGEKRGRIEAWLGDTEKWKTFRIPGYEDEGLDVRTVKGSMQTIQRDVTEANEKYRADNLQGRSFSEVKRQRLPWIPPPEPPKPPGYYEGESVEPAIEEVEEPIGETAEKPITMMKQLMQMTADERVAEEKRRAAELYAEEPRVKVEMNNPGNLKFADQADATGKTLAGFATFDTADDGWQALYNQIDADKGRGDTLHEFIYGKGAGDYGYTATDREVYEKNLAKELNLSPKAKIDSVDTKKLANAIAKQEGYRGEFPDLEEEPEVKEVKKSIYVKQLTKEIKGKRVADLSVANPPSFKRQQVDLQNIASSKFKSLGKEDKKKHGNVRDFVKSKFEEWIKKTGKLRKANWKTKDKYAVEDFQYFIPTSVNTKGEMRQKGSQRPVSQYEFDLFDPRVNKHPAFVRAGVLPAVTTSSGYEQFAKDFDDFRKFLQES